MSLNRGFRTRRGRPGDLGTLIVFTTPSTAGRSPWGVTRPAQPAKRGHSALPGPSPKGAGPRMGVARCSPAPPHPMRGLRPRPKGKRVRSGSSQAILAPGQRTRGCGLVKYGACNSWAVCGRFSSCPRLSIPHGRVPWVLLPGLHPAPGLVVLP